MPDEILIFGAIGTQVVADRKIFELVAIGGQGSVTWRTRCVTCHSAVFTEVKAGKLPVRARCNAHLQPSRHPEMPMVEYQHEAELAAMAEARPMAMIKPEEFIAGVQAGMDRLIAKHLTEDPGGEYIRNRGAAERGMRIVGEAKSAIEATQNMHPNAAPLVGHIKMHMGDEDDTSVEAPIGEHTGGPLVLDVDAHKQGLVETGRHIAEEATATAYNQVGFAFNQIGIEPKEEEPDDPYSVEAQLAELAELAPEGGDGPPPPLPEEDIWIPRLEKFYRDRLWLPSWGERPDQPGCWAPEEYLDRYRRR